MSSPSEKDEGLLRLISNSAANKGRLEINYKGEWGTICSTRFDDVGAAVACRQLGYRSGQMIRHHYVEDGQGSIWFDNINCSGSENKLIKCTHSINTLHCSHWFDVGRYCYLSCPLEEDAGDTLLKVEVFKLWKRLKCVNTSNICKKVYTWAIRRKSSWDDRVLQLARKYSLIINVEDEIDMNNVWDSSQTFEKESWHHEAWNDKNNVNGNK
ncbi:Hypothetical predicted protein [Mytilus galloprovincialis]|uniref:SRCR domain-containing protein n=1 Tax=Mytilus galloprovincialis TaxID=29158 RepID=A0A8B6EAZ7_MYTGA|nr:Hypothetical predicted protein [Mytilus galloprovincialis]